MHTLIPAISPKSCTLAGAKNQSAVVHQIEPDLQQDIMGALGCAAMVLPDLFFGDLFGEGRQLLCKFRFLKVWRLKPFFAQRAWAMDVA